MVMRVGVVGCGNISKIYLSMANRFRDFEIVAISDLRAEAAAAQAESFGVRAIPVSELIESDNIDIVLNLTIPSAHADVSIAALTAGKHVYTEKPLAASLIDGRRISETAKQTGLRVGIAPDTFLGAGAQTALRLIEGGAIGTPIIGSAAIMSRGMEHWHPNPEFFFKPGGGPVLDMGPYYVTTLVAMLGPVHKVNAVGQIGLVERTVTAEGSPFFGSTIKVEVLTSVQAILTFKSGAQVTLQCSWDVWRHGLLPIEVHGTAGSIRVPDPNTFGGVVSLSAEGAEWEAIDTSELAFGVPNWPLDAPARVNYRGLGLAEMANAISHDRPHRANAALGLHTLAVLEGILQSATEEKPVIINETCERPALLSQAEARELLANAAPIA
ncbi:Gfo/Idh/MocA family protein [Agrobacterium tumefaciens]|uniref:Gfo/Idh/MocA family protein n=1 Tax=Agrobacterium tumefaciens TaxID=358 RepID=UPI0009B72AEE|nr:Gfo/Idh/MocA family oxidoreductase [Agrobacterium tumefaciens]